MIIKNRTIDRIQITACLCFLLYVSAVSCFVPSPAEEEETPIYIKFARNDVWRSWMQESGRVNLDAPTLPLTTDNSIREKKCMYSHIRGGIASHHLLIAPVLTAYYKKLVDMKPTISTFFIVGPDHFRMSRQRIAVGTRPYRWGKKKVAINEEAAGTLLKELALQKDPVPFINEHSITTHIPFIAFFFPGSTIVPIIIDADCPLSFCRRASACIRRYMEENPESFFLLSIDFSHHLDAVETRKRDEISLGVLKEMNPRITRDITCDSPKSWHLFTNSFAGTKICTDIIFYMTNETYIGKSCPDITSYYLAFLRSP